MYSDGSMNVVQKFSFHQCTAKELSVVCTRLYYVCSNA